tara:strand:- start:206 stop:379 length:174 start_codon:yes stop_codon:yes gene_type:complete
MKMTNQLAKVVHQENITTKQAAVMQLLAKNVQMGNTMTFQDNHPNRVAKMIVMLDRI